jgi:hypothetical protein
LRVRPGGQLEHPTEYVVRRFLKACPDRFDLLVDIEVDFDLPELAHDAAFSCYAGIT